MKKIKWKQDELYSYLGKFISYLHHISVTNSKKESIVLPEGIKQAIELIVKMKKKNGALLFVGNGAGAAIASHQSTDFIRTCKIKAKFITDPSLLTCMANDCGYENVFSESMKVQLEKKIF